MKIKLFLTLIISFLTFNLTQAHALWIETSTKGQINQKHTVKVFYGEYAEQTIDPVNKWYSDLKDFELYLINPRGEKTKLEKQENTDHFISEFIPTKNGTYTLSVVHAAQEPYETMRFEFSSVAFVNIGNSEIKGNQLPFHVETTGPDLHVTSELSLKVLDNSSPQNETEVNIMGPEGWTKTLHSDKNGIVVFKPFISGKYIIEASKTDDKVEDWNGQKVEKIWRGSTLTIQVN